MPPARQLSSPVPRWNLHIGCDSLGSKTTLIHAHLHPSQKRQITVPPRVSPRKTKGCSPVIWKWGRLCVGVQDFTILNTPTCHCSLILGCLRQEKPASQHTAFCISGQCQLSIIWTGNTINSLRKGESLPTGVGVPHTPHRLQTRIATNRHQWLLQTYRICKFPTPSSPAQQVLWIKSRC